MESYDDELGLGRDGRLEVRGIDLEQVLFASRNAHGHPPNSPIWEKKSYPGSTMTSSPGSMSGDRVEMTCMAPTPTKISARIGDDPVLWQPAMASQVETLAGG
jgi:hypothetical protein